MLGKKEKADIQRREQLRLRLLWGLGAIANLFWWALTRYYFPNQEDSLFLRSLISAVLLLCLLLSLRFDWWTRYKKAASSASTWLLMLYGFYMLYQNGWHVHHVVGTFAAASVMYTFLTKRSEALVATLAILTLTIVTTLWGAGGSAEHLILNLAWVGSVVIVGAVVSFMRNELINELTEVEALSSKVLESMGEGVMAFNAAGEVISMNMAARKIFSMESIGQEDRPVPVTTVHEHKWQVYDDEGRALAPDDYPVMVALKTGNALHQRELYLKKPEGGHLPISVNVAPLTREGESTPYMAIVTVQDITEKKKAELEILSQQAQLTQAMKFTVLGEMAGGIAHEINNPLAILVIHATQIREAINQPQIPVAELHGALDVVDRTIERISKIVRNMRNFSRDGSNDPIEIESISKIIKGVLDLMSERFKKYAIDVQYTTEDPLFVRGRQAELSQVFLGLLQNAREAISDLEIKWVKIKSYREGRDVVVTVTDSGGGVPLELQEKLMEPFFSTKKVGHGVGLSLSAAQGIIAMHGGTLTYNTQSEHTQFVVRLPSADVSESTI